MVEWFCSEMIDLTIDGHVATITLNKPEVRNALGADMLAKLAELLDRVCSMDQLRIILLKGNGPVFCAGADISAGYGEGVSNAKELLEISYRPIFQAIMASEKLFIAALNGFSVGVGASLVMACDLVVMAERAGLAFPFSNLALVPDGGASWLLSRQIGPKRAMKIFLEAQSISAAQCLELGLCNRVVVDGELDTAADEWANQLADRSPVCNRNIKALIHRSADQDFDHIFSLEADYQLISEETEDSKEALRAFREKRAPVFTGT